MKNFFSFKNVSFLNFQVEEIESALESAFQTAAALHKPSSSTNFTKPLSPTNQQSPQRRRMTAIPSTAPNNHSHVDVVQCQQHVTPSVLLNRLFGSKSRSEIHSNSQENAATTSKQRRRPFSAVFSQALHRLSAASIYNKRV